MASQYQIDLIRLPHPMFIVYAENVDDSVYLSVLEVVSLSVKTEYPGPGRPDTREEVRYMVRDIIGGLDADTEIYRLDTALGYSDSNPRMVLIGPNAKEELGIMAKDNFARFRRSAARLRKWQPFGPGESEEMDPRSKAAVQTISRDFRMDLLEDPSES